MDQFASAKLDRDQLWKVDCVWDRSFDKESAWHTKVTVDFRNGYTVSHEVSGPKTYEQGLSNNDIRGKWSMSAENVLSPEKKEQVECLVLNMEGMGDKSTD